MTQIILLGGGGHAKVLIDCLILLPVKILGIIEKNSALVGNKVNGVPIIGDDSELKKFSIKEIKLVNAIGSVNVSRHRKEVFLHYKHAGYKFFSVIHPQAVISPHAVLGEGSQVMAGSIIQADVRAGDNTIVNTGVVVEHDCVIEDHVHLAPRCVLSGNVLIGESSHIGTGAVIIQGVKLGAEVLVAAGAVVIRDVAQGSAIAGVPARSIAESKEKVCGQME